MQVVHRDDVDPATRAWWDGICKETTEAMQDYCMPYVAPISHAIEDDWGTLEGTGGYLGLANKRLLLTNEHVTREWKTKTFAHQFHGCEDVFRLNTPSAIEPHPIDLAISAVTDTVWQHSSHGALTVPMARIAKKHDAVSGELFFFAGYPEKRSKSLYKSLHCRAARLVTQEPPTPTPADLHENYFRLIYSPERARSVDPTIQVDLTDPHGMSGSLVWNTRRVECHQNGRTWSPELAQVAGVLCRWDSTTSTVIAVRIEVVRDFLKRRCGSST